jgi:integrase
MPPTIILRQYPEDRICVLSHLQEYTRRTKMHRGHIDQLFISCKKSYKAVTTNTTSRWIKYILAASGVNTHSHGPGSTRAAPTSKALQQGAPIDTIMRSAGWSNISTFAKFYKKEIIVEQDFTGYILPKTTDLEN